MDNFRCGICNEETSSVLEFLQHKSQHAGPGAGIYCEFCKISYTRKVTLHEHYRLKHRITLNTDSLKCKTGEVTGKTTKITKKQSKTKKDDYKQNDVKTDESNQTVGVLSQLTKHLNVGVEDVERVDSLPSVLVKENGVTAEYLTAADITTSVFEKNEGISCERNGETNICTNDKNVGVQNVLLTLDEKSNNNNNNICQKVNYILNTGGENVDMLKPDSQIKLQDDTVGDDGDFHFILLTNMKDGASMSYGKLVYKCLHCDYQTEWKASVSRHMKHKHQELLTLHKKIKVFSEETDGCKIVKMSEFNISQAKLKAKNGKKRIRPIEKQDLIGHFVCPKCNKIFNRLRYLRKHLLTHRTEQKFLCDECGKSFKTQSYLTNHRKIHKKEGYSCKQCDFSSTISSVIQAHRQIHSDGCVICDICGLAYMDKSTLSKHKQVHDSNRPFACRHPGCTWRFKTEKMCHAHTKSHSAGAGKFACLKCGYVFRHKHHLKRHEIKMHGIQQHKNDKDLNVQEISKSELCIEQMETVSLIVDPDMEPQQYHLETALQNSQLVIATDEDGNAVNYEVTDIAMSADYQKLLQGSDSQTVESHAILIPHPGDGEIVLEHDNAILSQEPSDIETVSCSIGSEIAV